MGTLIDDRIDLYETDHPLWLAGQAAALRRAAGVAAGLGVDADRVAEELEDLGRSERHAVESFLETVIEHLLKLAQSPAAAPRVGWMITVRKARTNLHRKLTPSLRRHLSETLPERYAEGRALAALGLRADTVPEAALPRDCLWTLEQLLAPTWWPESRFGLD